MTDVLTPEQRSYCMSRIQSRDTKPEVVVRKMLHSLGYRYKLHDKSLPGKPDLVFPGRKKIILVHGCFWHRHNCRWGKVKPQTNTDFWNDKLQKNVERDKRTRKELKKMGWKVFVVWECHTRQKRREWLLERLVSFLDSQGTLK